MVSDAATVLRGRVAPEKWVVSGSFRLASQQHSDGPVLPTHRIARSRSACDGEPRARRGPIRGRSMHRPGSRGRDKDPDGRVHVSGSPGKVDSGPTRLVVDR